MPHKRQTHRYLLNEHGYQMFGYQLLERFGLKPSSPIPPEYTDSRVIDGVFVRITKANGGKHRCIATCPECRKEVPAGRLMQHVGTRRCREG